MSKQTKSSSIARRMATQFWGEVQHQVKLGDGIWLFDTAGHGGIIVDIDVRPELKEFQHTVYYGRGQRWYIESEQHFAAFEEDCEAAKVEWTYPEIMDKVSQRFQITGSLEDWKQARLEVLRRSLQQWNAEWLAAHPEPGWRL